MLFNSITFLIFFALVFLIYWGLMAKTLRGRNSFVLACSYIFYGWWDWRFLSLIFISSLSDYLIGQRIERAAEGDRTKRIYLALSLAINLGILGLFKYFNFFLDSLQYGFQGLGMDGSNWRLDIVLPVGISFYTFQTLSYTIDIYRGQLRATRDPIAFFAFVAFFPQLVAGPIERAKDLLPQFSLKPAFDKAAIRSGFTLVLWGLFKKVVIADRLALFVNAAFDEPAGLDSSTAAVALLFFAFQLYLDFSAYSEIAIGIARMLGVRLSTNFKRPYLAASFGQFWSRWHISLSSWFRDYLYIPLGGNRRSKWHTWRNVMIVFLLSGLWHGASWNFVIWGLLNGVFLVVLDPLIIQPFRRLGGAGRAVQAILVTLCWTLSLGFFRAQGWDGAIEVYRALAGGNGAFTVLGMGEPEFQLLLWLLGGMMAIEWIQENWPSASERLQSSPVLVRWSIYYGLSMGIILLGSYGLNLADKQFIYFQF
ncbi:MAG: membrane-bound O-acyltransferase family protein [Crocinitomicaceae bacterium]|nr:membrane-bound O-acyltransferase family protein [Crocinitomicaceae bacterium]